MKKKMIAMLISVCMILSMMSTLAFANVDPADEKYHDPFIWTDTNLYTEAEIDANNKAMWNITQYKIDYTANKVSSPKETASVNTVMVVSPAAISITIKDGDIIKIKDAEGSYDSRDEFIFDLYLTDSVDLIVTALHIDELNITDEEMIDIFTYLSEDMQVELFANLNSEEQVTIFGAYDDDRSWNILPIGLAMESYNKTDMLELYYAAKANKQISHLSGSDFDEYRLIIYLSKTNSKEVKKYLKTIYKEKTSYNDLVRVMYSVIDSEGDTEILMYDTLQTSWNMFIDTESSYSCLYYDSDDDFEDSLSDTYKRVYKLYIEMNKKFIKL